MEELRYKDTDQKYRKQIEDLTYQVKLMAANNQTLNLQNQMQHSEIERLLRYIAELQHEMKKNNKPKKCDKMQIMKIINKLCLQLKHHTLEEQIYFEKIIENII